MNCWKIYLNDIFGVTASQNFNIIKNPFKVDRFFLNHINIIEKRKETLIETFIYEPYFRG